MTRLNSIRNAIICEDIRKEIGNKLTLVGVYSGDIIVGRFPADLWLAFYAEFLPSQSGKIPLQIEMLMGRHRKPLVRVEGAMIVEDASDVAVIALPKFRANFPGPTAFTFRVALDDKKWQVALRKAVRLGEVST